MNLAHFKAQRQAFLLDAEAELIDGQSMAGCIPIVIHRGRGQARSRVQRFARQIIEDQVDAYLISLTIKGVLTIEQDQRSTELESGSFGMSYTKLPLTITATPDMELDHLSYHLLVPSSFVRERVNDPRRLCSTSFPMGDGGAPIARDIIVSLYDRTDAMDRGTSELLARAAVDALLDVAAKSCVAKTEERTGKRDANLRRILDYIELHCSDPDLSPKKAAQGCGISTRYVHQLLKDANLRFGSHVGMRRLHSAQRQLALRHKSRRSIAEIAYAVGFKSNAHFCRAYRKAFGTTPRSVSAAMVAAPESDG